MTDPEPYDHYRADGSTHPEGIYRVVGVDEDGVVLLRLTDGTGRRINTGHVERVDGDTLADAFGPGSNPDEGFRPSDIVDSVSAVLSMVRYRFLP